MFCESLTEVNALACLAAHPEAGQTVTRKRENNGNGHQHPRNGLGSAEGEADPSRLALLLAGNNRKEKNRREKKTEEKKEKGGKKINAQNFCGKIKNAKRTKPSRTNQNKTGKKEKAKEKNTASVWVAPKGKADSSRLSYLLTERNRNSEINTTNKSINI